MDAVALQSGDDAWLVPEAFGVHVFPESAVDEQNRGHGGHPVLVDVAGEYQRRMLVGISAVLAIRA
ncbi:hypothetical protein WEI85_33265 [Actinomycetes bacterium KLBMP 9797]